MPRQRSANSADRTPVPEATIIDDDSKEVEQLKEISTKLSLLLSKIDDLNQNFQEWSDRTVTNETAVTQENIRPTLEKLTDTLNQLAMPTNQLNQTVNTEATELFIEQEARKLKTHMSTIWNVNLNARRQAYWLSTRSRNISTKYSEWKQAEEVILPQHIQMKIIKYEPDNQRKRREKQVTDNLTAEIELLQLRADSHESKYKECDEKMKEEITKHVTGQLRLLTIKLWEEDCRRNEEISKKRWESRNATWLQQYEETFKRNYSNQNPYFKADEENDRRRTYADVARSNNQRQFVNTRNRNDRAAENPRWINQRQRNQYDGNNDRSQSRERRQNIRRDNQAAIPDIERRNQFQSATTTGNRNPQRRIFGEDERRNPSPGATARYDTDNRQPFADGNYRNRRNFLEQEPIQNYRP